MAARIVVACGSGVATSHTVANKISKLLAARGIDAEVVAVDVASLADALVGADAYIPVVSTHEDYDVPVFNGVAFLTGMNEEEELERLIAAVGDK
jgi:PTS system galactitol-specific IIB component